MRSSRVCPGHGGRWTWPAPRSKRGRGQGRKAVGRGSLHLLCVVKRRLGGLRVLRRVVLLQPIGRIDVWRSLRLYDMLLLHMQAIQLPLQMLLLHPDGEQLLVPAEILRWQRLRLFAARGVCCVYRTTRGAEMLEGG